jgi:hypothetical protein
MSGGWRVIFAEIGKRLFQIVMAVVVEEVVRRNFETAFSSTDNTIKYEKPRLKQVTLIPENKE